jgi:hypothetical protein
MRLYGVDKFMVHLIYTLNTPRGDHYQLNENYHSDSKFLVWLARY